MQFTPAFFLFAANMALAASAPWTASLPNLFLGGIDGCGSNKYGPDWFAWFEGNPVCGGSDLGPMTIYPNPWMIHGLCDKEQVTLEGYANITFTGCAPAPNSTSNAGPPSGVSINRTSVLTCENIASQSQTTECDSPCGPQSPRVSVVTQLRCHRQAEEDVEPSSMAMVTNTGLPSTEAVPLRG